MAVTGPGIDVDDARADNGLVQKMSWCVRIRHRPRLPQRAAPVGTHVPLCLGASACWYVGNRNPARMTSELITKEAMAVGGSTTHLIKLLSRLIKSLSRLIKSLSRWASGTMSIHSAKELRSNTPLSKDTCRCRSLAPWPGQSAFCRCG